LKRLFLHASQLDFIHPLNDKTMQFKAPLDEELSAFLKQL